MNASSRTPRVALGPMDASGCGAALAAGLREVGVEAEVAVTFAHPFGYVADRVLDRRMRPRYALRAARAFDVLHLQFGYSFAPALADARLARVLGRTVVMAFHGDDCRLYGLARALFPAQATFALAENDARVRRRLRRLARVCHAAVVKDLELAAYVYPLFDRVYVAPTALAVDPAPRRHASETPVVLHAPSDPRYKGTALVEAVVSSLRARRRLEFRLVTQAPHDRVQAELAAADVVVDQLNSAGVGVFALEAMRAGLPVLAEIDSRTLPPFQTTVPIVRVTPDTLEQALEALLDDPDRREQLGELGRTYVENTHAAPRAAEAALAIYSHARSGPPGLYEATAAGVRPLDTMSADERARRRGNVTLPVPVRS
jgi:Glycosyl transferases group 1